MSDIEVGSGSTAAWVGRRGGGLPRRAVSCTLMGSVVGVCGAAGRVFGLPALRGRAVRSAALKRPLRSETPFPREDLGFRTFVGSERSLESSEGVLFFEAIGNFVCQDKNCSVFKQHVDYHLRDG